VNTSNLGGTSDLVTAVNCSYSRLRPAVAQQAGDGAQECQHYRLDQQPMRAAKQTTGVQLVDLVIPGGSRRSRVERFARQLYAETAVLTGTG